MLKLLIVKTSSLGDVVHNLPIIHDILSHHPDAKIDWVVEESFADIARLHPAVNQVITVAMRRWRKSIFNRRTWHEINLAKRHIAAQPYDLILDTQGLIKSALISSFGHGQSHGYNRHSAREPLASLFYQQKHSVTRNQHAVTRNRTLAALALNYPVPDTAPNYGLTPGNQPAPKQTLSKPYVVFLHGTSRDSKLWPVSHWITLAHQFKQLNYQVVLPWSNADEETRAQAIAMQSENAVVLPKLNLADIAGVLAHATLNIGVDTGLVHLSTAFNKPTIAIYTDTEPKFTGVLPAIQGLAINIGGKAQIPGSDEVFKLAATLLPKQTL